MTTTTTTTEATMTTTTLPLRDGTQLAPTDTVWVERTDADGHAIVTSHATADCTGIHTGATVTATDWADARGDLFCPAQCLQVPGRDWAALVGTSDQRTSLLTGQALDDQAQRAADRDTTRLTTRTRNDASDKQLAFIGTLLEEKGLGDQDPASVLYPSDNGASRRDGRLTKKEASQLITLLKALPDAGNAPTDDTVPMPDDEVLGWLDSLGRKVDHSDLDALDDDTLARTEAAACRWAATQTGADFDWLADVARKAASGAWAPRYTKGVLNCWRRAPRAAAPAATGAPAAADPVDLAQLPAGRYAVPGGDTRLKLRIDKPTKGDWAGWAFVKDAAEYGSGRRYGKQAPGRTYTGDATDALRAIMADPAEAMRLYGELTDRCTFCNRVLEDEPSVAVGYGPTCADKHGLPWG